MHKYLIIRLSSFGDIAQALPAADFIRRQDPSSQIHWLTRMDFQGVVQTSPAIDKVIAVNRTFGLAGLLRTIWQLRSEDYTHIYDAHNNLRSHLIHWCLRLLGRTHRFLRRPKDRLRRFLLFRFHINGFPQPFRGTLSFLQPLSSWWPNIISRWGDYIPGPLQLKTATLEQEWPLQFPMSEAIVLAPGATWELKRWPIENWVFLTELHSDLPFVIIGGSEDHFTNIIQSKSTNKNILNLSGQLSWQQTMKVIEHARAVVSGDTGALHVADIMGKPCVALIGPTAFGYPTQNTSEVLEVELPCKPCSKDGRGQCKNIEYKKCMKDIHPHMVAETLSQILTNH